MEKKNEKSEKKSRKVLFFSLGTFFIFIFCYIIWSFLQHPAIGTVTRGEVSVRDDTSEKNKKEKRYDGKYISFLYPGEYVEKSNTFPTSGPVKESVFLTAENWGAQKIAVVVEERENNDSMASPSFLMRSNKPNLYVKSPFSQGMWQGFIFEKNEQVFEQTAFIRNEGKIVSISVSSPIKIDGLKEELQAFIDGLTWRE